jgi:hypothetical protein
MTNFPASSRGSFAHRRQGTAWDGRPYHAPDGALYGRYDRPRGCASLWRHSDARTEFYRVSRHEAGAFRRWAEAVFLHDDGRDRLAGRFPHYYVTNRLT